MTEERFWAKVNKEGPDGCWEWLACKDKDANGRFTSNGENILAHRYSWILHNGAIPEGLLVRHKCRGKCVNPEHLELGTNKDIANDKIRDGTDNRGIKNPNNKLTPEQVKEIRARATESRASLAKEYNVSYQLISQIILRKNWTWLT